MEMIGLIKTKLCTNNQETRRGPNRLLACVCVCVNSGTIDIDIILDSNLIYTHLVWINKKILIITNVRQLVMKLYAKNRSVTLCQSPKWKPQQPSVWPAMTKSLPCRPLCFHDDVIEWKHFSRYWPFVQGIHRSRWIPRTKASDAELWCLNKRFSKQTWGLWFETPSWSLWRHCNGNWLLRMPRFEFCPRQLQINSEFYMSGAHFTNMGLTIIPAWINNYIFYKVRDVITYPFPNLTILPLKFGDG